MTAKAEKMTKAIIAGDIAEVERLIAKGYPVSGKNILKQIETGGKKLSLIYHASGVCPLRKTV